MSSPNPIRTSQKECHEEVKKESESTPKGKTTFVQLGLPLNHVIKTVIVEGT